MSSDNLSTNAGGHRISPPTQAGTTVQVGGAQISPLKEYSIIGENSLQTISGGGVSGNGRLVFSQQLKSDDNNYALSFSLQPEGSLTLLAGTDSSLGNGASLQFLRRSDNKLAVQLTRGPESFDLSSEFTSVATTGALNIEIDVHGHGHLIVWVGTTQIGEYAFALPLTQRFWGLALDRAQVTKADVGPSKVEG